MVLEELAKVGGKMDQQLLNRLRDVEDKIKSLETMLLNIQDVCEEILEKIDKIRK